MIKKLVSLGIFSLIITTGIQAVLKKQADGSYRDTKTGKVLWPMGKEPGQRLLLGACSPAYFLTNYDPPADPRDIANLNRVLIEHGHNLRIVVLGPDKLKELN